MKALSSMLAALCMLSLAGCHPASDADSAQRAQGTTAFSCAAIPRDWVPADAITPDVVPPCKSGSTGMCRKGYTYVTGTGFCKPGT